MNNETSTLTVQKPVAPPWLPKDSMEQFALNMRLLYNPALLSEPLVEDPYDVLEKLNPDGTYEFQHLSRDGSVLGASLFQDCTIWVWERNECSQEWSRKTISCKKGTIIIDASLAEGDLTGREKFTVAHELFHQLLHRNVFDNNGIAYRSVRSVDLFGNVQDKSPVLKLPKPALDRCEYQANYCAAAFLMPKHLVERFFAEECNKRQCLPKTKIVKILAKKFGVSVQAMKYRLEKLNLVNTVK